MERTIFRSSQRFQQRDASSQQVISSNLRDVETIFSRASTSAARYVSDSSIENTAKLDESLSDVMRFISDVERSARLSIKNRHVFDFLSYTPVILSSSTTTAMTRSRFYRLLFNIALPNIPIRRFMTCELEMCSSVFHCLKLSLREQLGPQNMIDILRLLQVLSYEKTVSLGIWTNDLISFLISEIVREPEEEWMPYCIAILCNLATRSKSVCNRIKKSTSYKKFHKRLTDFLQHEARIVVVSCLVLIGYLEEQIRNLVYCTQNVHDTFICVFNVLILGDDDCLMTRQIAADLLKRLIVSDTPAVSSIPTLASTGKDVLNYGFFGTNIQKTAELLVVLDPRMEESSKVYDLLLSFCSLQVLRSPVCQAIIRCKPTEARLTTPILAITQTASLTIQQAINGEMPLKALKLLAHLLREIVEPNERVVPFVPLQQIVCLIDSCIKTNLREFETEEIDLALRRIQLGLRLAEVCSRDEDCRNELLAVCSAQNCREIASYQLYQNPVVIYLTKPPLQRTEPLDLSCLSGIGIVLEISRLLATLKDHSKAHKDQYWQLLKDDRLIPFLAYAISYGDQEMVSNALNTFLLCAQVHVFPSHLLAEMIASCTIEKRCLEKMEKKDKNLASSQEKNNGFISDRPSSTEQDEKSIKVLDELLKKVSIERGSLKDVKTSEIFTVFERKIAFLQAKEREMETMLRAKDEALKQSEKLRIQYRNIGGGGSGEGRGGNGEGGATFVSDEEMIKMRRIIEECEELKEKNEKLSKMLEETRKEAEIKVTEATKDLIRSSQECEKFKIELKEGQKLIDSFSITCEDLKKKLEFSTTNCLEQQQKLAQFEKEREQMLTEIQRMKMEFDRQKLTTENEILKLNAELAQKVTRIELFINENKEIKRQYDEKMVECEAVKEQLCQFETKCCVKEKELSRAHSQLSYAEEKLATKEREFGIALKEISHFQEQLAIKEKQMTNKENEISALKEDLEKTRLELGKLEKLREDMLSLASLNRR